MQSNVLEGYSKLGKSCTEKEISGYETFALLIVFYYISDSYS